MHKCQSTSIASNRCSVASDDIFRLQSSSSATSLVSVMWRGSAKEDDPVGKDGGRTNLDFENLNGFVGRVAAVVACRLEDE